MQVGRTHRIGMTLAQHPEVMLKFTIQDASATTSHVVCSYRGPDNAERAPGVRWTHDDEPLIEGHIKPAIETLVDVVLKDYPHFGIDPAVAKQQMTDTIVRQMEGKTLEAMFEEFNKTVVTDMIRGQVLPPRVVSLLRDVFFAGAISETSLRDQNIDTTSDLAGYMLSKGVNPFES